MSVKKQLVDKLNFYNDQFNGQIYDMIKDANFGLRVKVNMSDKSDSITVYQEENIIIVNIHKNTNLSDRIVEHILVHILFEVLRKDNPKYAFYNDHSSILFKCISESLFGYVDNDEWHIDTPKMGLFDWKDNSCYLDHLLAILFYNPSSIWLRAIENYKYTGPIPNNKHITDNKTYQKNLQQQLLTDYNRLRSGDDFYCSSLRNVLRQAMPDMYRSHRWVFYEVLRVYNLLCSVFPDMLFSVDVKRTPNSSVSETRQVEYVNVESYLTYDDIGENVIWDTFDASHIVFLNKGSIPTMTTVGEEKTYTYNQETEFNKIRKLDMTIVINEYNYDLVGAIRLHGYNPPYSLGAHYNCYFKYLDLQWYKYDDTSGIEQVTPTASDILNTNGTTISEMIFYVRRDSIGK